MATNYPTSLDSYSDVSTGDTIQATTTNNVQDAVEALQSKVGVDSSAVTTSVDYKLRNLPTQESDLNLGSKAIIAWDGWLADSRTWTYASATSFTIAGVDVTAQFPKGTRIRYKQGGSYEYGTVASTSFSTNTTVNLAPNDDYALANAAITDAGYSYAASPQVFPDWFGFTPTLSASGSMTYTSPTIDRARFRIIGRKMEVVLRFNATIGGTASTQIITTLPVTASVGSTFLNAGSCDISEGSTIFGGVATTANDGNTVRFNKYDGSNISLGAGRQVRAFLHLEI